MNKLWVRLSFMISLVLFSVFFLQFLEIMSSDLRPDELTADMDSPAFAPEEEIAWRLVEFMGLSLVVGTIGGVMIGRVVSAPITELAQAAGRIGRGELTVSVPVRGSEELQNLALTFNKMAADLHQAEQLRKNLMADVSHELRTPLAILEGNLRAALDHVYDLDEAEIANLYGQTRHLIRLVNDLRELSLAEAGQLPLEKTAVSLPHFVAEIIQALEPITAEKEVAVVEQLGPLPLIEGDTLRLRQVFFNLLSNAVRHTPAGGQIVISGRVTPPTLTLTIQDNGEGLEPEQLASIFDRFYRADKSRSRETGGTGLGLAIVKAIVEAHGGRVWAESPGRAAGMTIYLQFPLPTSPLLAP